MCMFVHKSLRVHVVKHVAVVVLGEMIGYIVCYKPHELLLLYYHISEQNQPNSKVACLMDL